MRYLELIEKTTFTPEMVEKLKSMYDNGLTYREIATKLNIDTKSAINALNRYYKDRPKRLESKIANLDDASKNAIVDAFFGGKSVAELAKAYDVSIYGMSYLISKIVGKTKFQQELDKRKTQSGVQTGYKVTPEMIKIMRKLWAAGIPSTEIADKLDNVIASRNVLYHMRKQPDFDELQLRRDSAQAPIKPKDDASTKIHRPGVGGNLRSKGPGSKHAHGMFRSNKDL